MRPATEKRWLSFAWRPEKTLPIIDASLDVTAIIADALMVLLLARDKLSYFQSYKNYFSAIYIFFLGFPIGALVKILFYNQPSVMVFGTQLLVTSGASIAMIWGYVATRLYMYPEPLNLRRLVSSPFRP